MTAPEQRRTKNRSSRWSRLRGANQGRMDLSFGILVVLLMSIGLIMLFSASYASAYYDYEGNSAYLFLRQGLFAVVGVAVMIGVSLVDYQWLRALSFPLLLISIFFLILVPFIGVTVSGAQRWLELFGIQFQPSEIAKMGVILMFSNLISLYKEKMRTFKYGILPFAVILVVVCGLLAIQPHLSGIVLILTVGAVLMIVGGVNLKWVGIGTAALIPLGILLVSLYPHAQRRIAVWLNPYLDAQDSGYQVIQSWYAIGSGGLLGLGFGKSRQKYLYLPEEHNDFIFSIVCEELGYLGATLILLLFAVLVLRGFWIALHARDRFGALLVTGIISLLGLQTFFNVAVVTGLVPATGISLPFFSYGGTSLVIQMAEMGVVLSVSRQMRLTKEGSGG